MFSAGQRLLLRRGKFAQFIRPVSRLDGQIIEVMLVDGSTLFVNALDAMATDWSGMERRRGERRKDERRKTPLLMDRQFDLRRQPDRRSTDRRTFVTSRKREATRDGAYRESRQP